MAAAGREAVGRPSKEHLPVAQLACIMAVLISLGCVNFILLKELYTAYGDQYAFFVNQGVNFLYIVYGGAILYPRMCLTNAVTPTMKALSKKRFVVMGFLDALGTFFTAMGAAFTPGSMQPLLNQTLIPWIIMVSRVYLKKIYSSGELSGALLIMLGACTSALPPILLPHSEDDMRWYAVFFYALSNVPMAMSACYKEGNFQEQELDVWYLTQWVSIFQFLISFLFVPLLCLPGFGSVHGTPLVDLPGQFYGGFLCCLQVTDECAEKPTFWLLIGYCGVNVMYNTLGLYLVKVASALMNALSYAILLPCTTLLFFTPLAGVAQEHFSAYDWFTVAGLVFVLAGFVQYQRHGRVVHLEELPTDLVRTITPEDFEKCLHAPQQSFQERVIGSGLAHGFGMDVAEVRRVFGTDWELVRPLMGGTSSHTHRYRHQHGGSSPHWHVIDHDHKYDPLSDHAHGHDAEHEHSDEAHSHSHGHDHTNGAGHSNGHGVGHSQVAACGHSHNGR
mmetsp:Transcript_79704/g.200532  ORF Transcript_79704/g.200532 Transcript_79704/m.200532 type:complete len:504 (-) Transcript_79704:191-1702(-)